MKINQVGYVAKEQENMRLDANITVHGFVSILKVVDMCLHQHCYVQYRQGAH